MYLILCYLKSNAWSTKTYPPTLKYLISKHARLTFFKFFPILLALIRSCSFNYFGKFFYPACLLHPALLIILSTNNQSLRDLTFRALETHYVFISEQREQYSSNSFYNYAFRTVVFFVVLNFRKLFKRGNR